jgi:hypothetical protein
MIFLSPDDWYERCASAKVAVDRHGHAPWFLVPANASALPNERLHILSRELARWASESAAGEAHAFLCVYESGIFPSSDRRVLYQALRARHGNFDSIETSPGHEFLGHERAELEAVIECAVLNAWGITVEFEGALRAFRIDHDGNVSIWEERGECGEAAESIARLLRVRA